MVDIIALIFLCRKIGRLAVQKGLRSLHWRMYTILAWTMAELAGVIFAISLFGQNNLFGILSIGLISGFGGYLIIKATLDSLPDVLEKDIKRVGIEDLGPKKDKENIL